MIPAKKLVLALVLLLAVPATPALAQALSSPLHDAVVREARVAARSAGTNAQSPPASERSWVVRHPALTGMLVGLGAGATIGAVTCKFPGAEGPCDYYTYPERARVAGALTIGGIGAGIGAGVGALVGVLKGW